MYAICMIYNIYIIKYIYIKKTKQKVNNRIIQIANIQENKNKYKSIFKD